MEDRYSGIQDLLTCRGHPKERALMRCTIREPNSGTLALGDRVVYRIVKVWESRSDRLHVVSKSIMTFNIDTERAAED